MSEPANDEPAAEPSPLAEPSPATRPGDVPEKFWDGEAGTIRVDALLRSYLELERKLGATQRATIAQSRVEPELETAPVEPAAEPEPWAIASPHPLIETDEELNTRLRAAGFDQRQAQLVYDLAAERLMPMLDDALGEIEAQRQLERLQRHFGGVESWAQTARQLKSWGAAHLAPAVLETLAASYEGVLALHQMMQASEPELLAGAAEPAADLNEAALAEMMRDPRYWRQRDPEFIARVTAGFKRIYAA